MPGKRFARTASAAAFVLACTGANAASLLSNGDFELDASDVASGGHTRVGAGASTINDWTVVGTSVDLIRNAYGAIANVSVDLAGTPGPGGIEQSFVATANQAYRLSWEYFTNGASTINFTISVYGSSGDLASVSISNAPSAITPSFLDFVAPASNSYTVRFYTANESNNGPTVDNITLETRAVPEPAQWALLLAGLAVLGVSSRHRTKTSVSETTR